MAESDSLRSQECDPTEPRQDASKVRPRPIDDEYFSNRRNDILNSGQAFYFAHLERRFFERKNRPFDCPMPIHQPEVGTQKLAEMLLIPVGITTDRLEPRFSGNVAVLRAGKPAYLGAVAVGKSQSLK